MSCLLCLRNEGIQFPNDSNDLEILLSLFKLPQEFSETLEGNDCCSLCRVKLQFVAVINQEMTILNQKLKHFEEEVKNIFVSSFDQFEADGSELDEIAKQARAKLLNELYDKGEGEEENFTEFPNHSAESTVFSNFDATNDQEENSEFGFSGSSQIAKNSVKAEIDEVDEDPLNVSAPHFVNLTREPAEEPSGIFPNFPHSSSIPTPELFEEPQISTFQFPSIKLIKKEKFQRRRLKATEISSRLLRLNRIPQRIRMRNPSCRICPAKTDFESEEDFEIHLQTVHPKRLYSQCPICHRIILEQNKSNSYLKCHLKDVHPQNRKFQCDQCEASFKTNSTLRVHKQLHTNREIFICDICDSHQTGQRNYNRHMKKHTGGR